ncbi:MAG TPA: hypothetical protein VMV68_07315 [Spirochaetia bacterium]|nr:hypothetical protein [Spirochaetia bacterium]
MGAAAASFSIDFPIARAWSFELGPSFYWTASPDSSIIQLSAGAGARLYPGSLFGRSDRSSTDLRGIYLSGGVVGTWQRMSSWSAVDVISVGPALHAGYRLLIGSGRFYLEPAFGWTALFGTQLQTSGSSFVMNTAFGGGLTAGYRF